MTAFYNEIDPYAAAWLRNLIAAGHIAPGVVDERSIEDIVPEELLGYTQCHFFAGIGVWSYALRRAGWPDDRPVWTGSCPCQPFSAAGKGAGAADLRHLWPAWHHLIAAVQPPVVFGEQVEAAIRHGWLDLVQADLEGIGYAFGAAGLPAAGVGPPHIRQRLWFVADAITHDVVQWQDDVRETEPAGRSAVGGLAHHRHPGLEGGECPRERTGLQRQTVERGGEVGELGDTSMYGCAAHQVRRTTGEGEGEGGVFQSQRPSAYPLVNPQGEQVGLSRCSWESGIADWIPCRDGKWRPVEPGTFPLAHGAPSRVGRLRAYGNAIVAPCAEAFIRSAVEAFELRDMLS